MNNSSPPIGQILTEEQITRDAIHIAVFSATSTEKVYPNEDVGIVGHEHGTDLYFVSSSTEKGFCGKVDPFLRNPVLPGKIFLVFLYPNTITGMKHIYSHPHLDNWDESVDTEMKKAKDYLMRAVGSLGFNSYDELRDWVGDIFQGYDEDCLHTDSGSEWMNENSEEFWKNYEMVYGSRPREVPKYYRCAC